MEKLSQLDEMLAKGKESYKTLTVGVEASMANLLSSYAKKLGVSRTKLVKEIFLKGLEWFNDQMDGKVWENDLENGMSIVSGSTAFDAKDEAHADG